MLDRYRERIRAGRTEQGDAEGFFRELYDRLEAHGFELVPYEWAWEHAQRLRDTYAPQMEFLIDELLAPRGFWSPDRVDVPLLSTTHPEVLHHVPPGR
ncbi:MAG: hypothetical protein ACLGIR_04200 [Actinomycetes bacterium]